MDLGAGDDLLTGENVHPNHRYPPLPFGVQAAACSRNNHTRLCVSIKGMLGFLRHVHEHLPPDDASVEEAEEEAAEFRTAGLANPER
jgi:hypothetical protein